MAEQKNRGDRRRRGHGGARPRQRRPLRHVVRRRHLQHRGLSGARRPRRVAYATALGDDPYSDSIVAMAAAEGVKTDLMLRVPGRLPGLYLIETDPKGERRFRYWRGAAPARELFELPDWNKVAETLVGAKLIYFSGVTLSLYSNIGLGRLLAVARAGAPAGRQGGVRRQLPALWLEGRPAAHPHACSWRRSSASTSRCRPSTTRPCCGAIRAPRPPSRGCRPSASPRSW